MPVPARTVLMMLLAAFVLGLGLGGFTVSRDAVKQVKLPRETAAGGTGPASSASRSASADAGDLTLTAQASGASGRSFMISGDLSPARSGVRVVVQRFEDGRWRDFPAQTTTSGGGTYRVALRSGRQGEQRFRVVSTGSEPSAISNEVRVTGA